MPKLASFANQQLMKAMFTFIPTVDSINQRNHYFCGLLHCFARRPTQFSWPHLFVSSGDRKGWGANRKLLRSFERKTTWTLILEIDENSSYGTFDSFTATGIWVSFGSRGHRGNECMHQQLISVLLEFKTHFVGLKMLFGGCKDVIFGSNDVILRD